MNTSDLIVFLGQVLGLVFSAFFSVVAIYYDTHDKSEKKILGVRRKRLWLAAAVTLSAVVAIVSFIIEFRDDLRDAEAERQTAVATLGGVQKNLEVATTGLTAAEESLNVATATLYGVEKSLSLETKTLEGVNKSLREVIRISNPIDRITLSITFLLPVEDPIFADQRRSLDRALSQTKKGMKNQWCTSWNMGSGKRYRGQDVLRPEDPSFPATGNPAEAFQIERVELVFFKRPILPEEFLWPISAPGVFFSGVFPERPEPDMVVAAEYSKDDKWCLIRRRKDKEVTYYLELTDWKVPEDQWQRDTVDIQYLQDLTTAQLFLDIGGQGGSPAIRQKMEVSSVDLRINGQPVAIEAATLRRREIANRWQNGHPFWEYRFPKSLSAMFRTSDDDTRRSQSP